MTSPGDFVGRGISFPMRVDHRGGIALAGDAEGIETSIRMVLSTAPGERVMRPDFGCAIWEMLFDPINGTTLGRMAEAVRESVARWEPRIDLVDVQLAPDPADAARVLIDIAYRIRATNDRRNLVYPFYVIPEEVET